MINLNKNRVINIYNLQKCLSEVFNLNQCTIDGPSSVDHTYYKFIEMTGNTSQSHILQVFDNIDVTDFKDKSNPFRLSNELYIEYDSGGRMAVIQLYKFTIEESNIDELIKQLDKVKSYGM